MNEQIPPEATAFIPMLEGVTKLFYPYVEGAIHDLKQGKVVAIFNNISRRKVGDASPIAELGINVRDFPDVFAPYYKTNWDGKKLKCTSITIRNAAGEPTGLVCVNFDTSVFENMSTQIEKLLTLPSKNGANPVDQFSNNWRQQVLDFIDSYAHTNNIAVAAMTPEQKATLVCKMYDHSLFNYRDAAAYVAMQLDVSRTTVYNYLKKGKK